MHIEAGPSPQGLTDRGEDNRKVDHTSTVAGWANRETHSRRGAAKAHWKLNEALQIAIVWVFPILEIQKLRHREAESTVMW